MGLAPVLICQLLVVSTCIYFVIGVNVNNCIRKCCPERYIINSDGSKCLMVNETHEFLYENVRYDNSKKICDNFKVPVSINEESFEIVENRILLYVHPVKRTKSTFSPDNYCIEHVENKGNITAVVCVNGPRNESTEENFRAVGEEIKGCIPKCCPHHSFLSEENCSEGNETVKLPFKNICLEHRNNCKTKVPFLVGSGNFRVENNSLKHTFHEQSVYFSNEDFCVDQLKSKNFAALICADIPKAEMIDEYLNFSSDNCVTKCCPHNYAFSYATSKCVNVHQRVRLPHDVCRITRKECRNGKVKAQLDGESVTVLPNYTLMYTFNDQSRFFDDYCLDYLDDVETLFAFVCIDSLKHIIVEQIGVTGMIISMPFLLATFIAYALLPDRNLHMKALMFYVINLMLSYLLLVIIQLSESAFPDGVCMAMGYFCLFFFLVSFFWMNVICVDIWFAFSGLRGFSGSKKIAERKRFLIYCAYAWGMPVLHVVIVYVIDALAPSNSQFRPGIGDGQCFLKRGYPELLYFYGPMAILITINVIFFAITASKIRSIKKDTSVLKKEDSKRHSYENDKQTFNLYLKLLFAMGVNWSMEIISWAVIWADKAPDAIWYLTDFCNAIYGVFIFFIFVFKRSIWKLLKKRYYSFIGKPHLAHSMTMTNTTRVTSYSTANSSVHENPHGVNDTSTLNSEA